MLANTTVTLGFNLPVTSSIAFILDDPVRGLLDSVTYTLAAAETDVTSYVSGISIKRGRDSLLWEDINAGTCSITLQNRTRIFDPTYTAGAYYGQILPGVAVVVQTDGYTIFTGRIADWNFDYDVEGTAIATVSCVDALGVLGSQEYDAWTATVGQLTGARISAILDRPEVSWNSGARSIATGNTTLQGDNKTWGSNVLNDAQLTARSELGYFYADQYGVLTFKDRYTGFNSTSVLAFGTGGLIFHEIATQYGSEQLFNRVGVDPEGLTKQTAYDATSAAAYGWSSLSLDGLLMDTEAQAADMANYLVGRFAQPVYQVSELGIKLHAATATPTTGYLSMANRASILALDITSLISVTWTPSGVGSASTSSLIVQGVDHDIGPDTHHVTLHLANAATTTVFTLDDPVYGLLDSAALLGF